MKKIYTFVLNFGYAESAGLSFLPWTSRVAFATARLALVDLAEFLKEEYLARHSVEPRKCCTASKAKDAQAGFCTKCGRSLANEEFNPVDYMQWVSDIAGCDNDTFSGEYIAWDESKRWQSEGLKKVLTSKGVSNARLVYVAESVLATAIGHSPDNRVTLDSIFRERTGSRENCFSFW